MEEVKQRVDGKVWRKIEVCRYEKETIAASDPEIPWCNHNGQLVNN